MTNKTLNFPSLEAVRKFIAKYDTTKLPQYKEGQDIDIFVNGILNKLLIDIDFLPSFLTILKKDNFPFKFFRARSLDSYHNINLFSEHSYPPLSLTKLGRCNFPNHPVFYCSNSPITALLEIIRETEFKQKQFCISRWEIADSGEEFVFENFLQTSIHPKNQFELLARHQREKINVPFGNKLPKDKELALLEFFKFIDTQFISDTQYSLSATLAHRRLYSRYDLSTDILMYPSIQTDKQGINLAITPNFVDNCMRVERCYIVELEDIAPTKDKFTLSVHKYGVSKKNVLEWKNVKPYDKDYQKLFEEDFQEFVSNGTVPEFIKISS